MLVKGPYCQKGNLPRAAADGIPGNYAVGFRKSSPVGPSAQDLSLGSQRLFLVNEQRFLTPGVNEDT